MPTFALFWSTIRTGGVPAGGVSSEIGSVGIGPGVIVCVPAQPASSSIASSKNPIIQRERKNARPEGPFLCIGETSLCCSTLSPASLVVGGVHCTRRARCCQVGKVGNIYVTVKPAASSVFTEPQMAGHARLADGRRRTMAGWEIEQLDGARGSYVVVEARYVY